MVKSPALEEHLFAPSVEGAFLHTSPEFSLKRVLAKGLPRVYSICPCFRKEEWGPLHTEEFTMVEWYRAGCGYWEIMVEVEELVRSLATVLCVPTDARPFQRLSYAEAFHRFTASPPPCDEVEAMRVWINDIEPRLIEPTFVYDYPSNQAAFATVRGEIAERFELYMNGVELANAFTELLDSTELRRRWESNNAARKASGQEPHPIDERVVAAVATHPRAGGVAVGFDRLLMVLCGGTDIREFQIPG